MTFNFYRWTSLFYGDHDEKPKVGSQESLDTHLHMQDTVSYLPFIAYRVRVMVFNGTFNNLSVISLRPVLLMEKTTDLPQITDKLCHIMLYRHNIYIYVWKLNQIVLELDFRAVKFCSSHDGIWTHTIDTLQHHSLSLTSSALDHSTTSTP